MVYWETYVYVYGLSVLGGSLVKKSGLPCLARLPTNSAPDDTLTDLGFDSAAPKQKDQEVDDRDPAIYVLGNDKADGWMNGWMDEWMDGWHGSGWELISTSLRRPSYGLRRPTLPCMYYLLPSPPQRDTSPFPHVEGLNPTIC